MHNRSLLSSIVLAGVSAISLAASTSAQAQGLFDFLWGGTQEWGGSRQTVSFDPKFTPGQIIVSFGDRRLYLITRKGQATSYPIAVPREQSRWQGTTTVSEKKINPSWRPTPDMLKENPKLPAWVPGGHPMNPLGVRAMYLGASTYRIHGTDAPWTIGQAVSKGCIRMLNEDVLDLYPRVPVGTKVTVTWQRFSDQAVAAGNDGESGVEPQPVMFGTGNAQPHNRVLRNMPPPQDASDDPIENAQTAAVRMEDIPTLEEKPARPAKSAKKSDGAKPEQAKSESKPDAAKSQPAKAEAAKSESPKTESKAEAAKSEPAKAESKSEAAKSEAANAPNAADRAAESAKKAAEAAGKAAEAAKKAAAEAKRAVEDAKKATADGDKSAAL